MIRAACALLASLALAAPAAFGTSGKARSSVLPDVPTISEAGVPGYEMGAHREDLGRAPVPLSASWASCAS